MKDLNNKTIERGKKLPVKVLQFGEGNFLRGFVDWIIDLLNEQTDFNGGVYIIQPIENGIVDLLKKQDCLYHVWLSGLSGGEKIDEKRLITSIAGAMDPHEDYEGFLKLAESSDLEFIISNTTEAGIAFDKGDKNISSLPSGFPGKVTALLFRRFEYFNGASDKGLTLIPCELIEKNGDKLREAVLQYADHFKLPQEFIYWVKAHNIFCNTLVDRIVPGFPKENINEIQKQLNYNDNLVVKAEPFHLWVVEAPESVRKAFPVEQTSLQVKFVEDLTPYRTRKVRILNGAHTSLVPLAYLEGLRTVRDSVDDEKMGKFIRQTIFEEIVPTLDLPADELNKFADDVIERFRNPYIHHELTSIALNSISKYKVRVLPSVLEFKKRFNKLPENLLLSLAALIIFYRGEWQGEKILLNDNPVILSFFKSAWEEDDIETLVKKVLSKEEFWGINLNTIDNLPSRVQLYLEKLLQEEQAHQAKTA